jgi:hypothetical protein
MNMDETQLGWAARSTGNIVWPCLFAALLAGSAGLSGCSSDDPAKSEALGNCGGRAEPLAAGMIVTSAQGYAFELSQLEPSVPVQSDSPPGNHWTVTITDPDGEKVTGATLAINTYMPDHGHSGPPAAAVETSDGSYDVIDLLFPMPTLYSVSLLLTLEGGETQTGSLTLCLDAASG